MDVNKIKYKSERKEHKFPRTTGIYLIGFEGTNKVYIGSASCQIFNSDGFNGRWKGHLSSLKKQKFVCVKLQHAFNKYGESSMFFRVVEECDPENCLKREQFFIDKFNSFENGYNSRPDAKSNLGFKHSKESKQKMINSAKKFRERHKPEVIKLLKSGYDGRKIARTLGISRCLVGRLIKEEGIGHLPRRGSVGRVVRQYQNDELIGEWRTIEEAAEKLNLSESTIRRYLNKEVKKPKLDLRSH